MSLNVLEYERKNSRPWKSLNSWRSAWKSLDSKFSEQNFVNVTSVCAQMSVLFSPVTWACFFFICCSNMSFPANPRLYYFLNFSKVSLEVLEFFCVCNVRTVLCVMYPQSSIATAQVIPWPIDIFFTGYFFAILISIM